VTDFTDSSRSMVVFYVYWYRKE